MLNTLSNIDPRTAQGILATLALGMMPNPGVGVVATETAIEPDLKDRLLQELRIKLRLKRDDHSQKAMAKLYAALADEMKRISVQGVDNNRIKARLGQQGILSPSQYQIKFDRSFREITEKCGITQYQTESAIRFPDSYEHLKPEHFGFDPDYACSLFMKVEQRTAHSERYILLVFANRKGYTQEVIGAWRVYPSDVDLRDASLPRDVLRAFVEKFGTTFKIGEKEGKFFMNERLPITHEKDGQNSVELFKIEPPQHLTLLIGAGKSNKNMTEAILSFTIDYKKYAESLKQHGVNVKLKDIIARLAPKG